MTDTKSGKHPLSRPDRSRKIRSKMPQRHIAMPTSLASPPKPEVWVTHSQSTIWKRNFIRYISLFSLLIVFVVI